MPCKDLGVLIPEFQVQIRTVLSNCSARGYVLQPYFTRRTAQEQASLWRQGRSPQVIEAEIAVLEKAGAHFLAKTLRNAKATGVGHSVTGAIPGMSWHEYDEAVDCMWMVSGIPNWNTGELVNGHNGYSILAEEAVKLGLTSGMHFPVADSDHVQFRKTGSPQAVYTLLQIDAEMQKRYGS